LLLSERARLAALDLPSSLPGVVTGRGHASFDCRVLRQVGGVVDDPGLDAWPALLGSCLASVVWALADFCVASRTAC
jgi:hypothetical protein